MHKKHKLQQLKNNLQHKVDRRNITIAIEIDVHFMKAVLALGGR